MIFPKGEVRHQNLLTSYTDISALLSALKTEGFSGIVVVEFPKMKGTIFIDSGDILNAEMRKEDNGGRMIGQEAVQTLLSSSNQKNGVLNVFGLQPEQVALVNKHLQHTILFEGLSTDFTRLDRFFLKLKEDRHDGFIEVLAKDKKALAVVIVEGGDPLEMYTLPESGPSVFGRKSIPVFLENAGKQGVVLNVYKSEGPLFIKREKSIPQDKPEEEEISMPEKSPLAGDKGKLKELISILQEVLSAAESAVDAASRKGTFIASFKRSLIDKADVFSFLDPFAGEFEYRDGEIRFSGRAEGKEFTKGVLECLINAMTILKKELPKNKMLSLKVGEEIRSSLEVHQETLKQLGLMEVVSPFFQ